MPRKESKEYQAKQAALVAEHIKKQDIVITTALIPGRPAPRLISKAMVDSMRPGSVIVDLAVERGGNVEGAKAGEVLISGTTTENCCHATARDAMFRNYRVVFLSDATATYDYPDRGFGAMPAADVHHATLVILAASTAHVMSVEDMRAI